jgi:hypothetical protein
MAVSEKAEHEIDETVEKEKLELNQFNVHTDNRVSTARHAPRKSHVFLCESIA